MQEEEARVAPLQAFERFVAAVQFVDCAHPAHADAASGGIVQRAQPVVEVRRAQVERAVQEFAVAIQSRMIIGIRIAVDHALHQRLVIHHLAPQHARLHQRAEALVDHLAAAVQALLERPQSTARDHRGMRLDAWRQRLQHPPVRGIVRVAQHQRVAERVG